MPLKLQTFQVLHTFEGPDGINPGALVVDSGGNLYETTAQGGIYNCSSPNLGCGTVLQALPYPVRVDLFKPI